MSKRAAGRLALCADAGGDQPSSLDEGSLISGFGSRYLVRLRFEAIRRGVWFKALSRLERGLVDFVIRAFDRPRSLRLIEPLARIVVKVKAALMSPLMRHAICVGRFLAVRISMVALKWGNKGAAKWAEDESFVRYLAVIDMNSAPGFRLSDMLLKKHM